MTLIVRLQGGLGNQLFQVAFAKHLERRTGRRVALDSSWFSNFEGGVPRQLEVSPAHCDVPFVCLPRVVFSRVARRLTAPFRVAERHPAEEVADRVGRLTSLVTGYFQSAQMVAAEADSMAVIIASHINNWRPHAEPYVAVHLRLGDYLSNPATRTRHAATDPSWLIDQGHLLVGASVANEVRVFTDDVCALRRLMPGRNDFVIDDAESSWQALSRMSRSAGLVMSNSTLSWWAAFAARHVHGSDIDVMCPTPWFAEASPIDDRIALPGWARVERSFLESA